jgi:hypothetical protein
VERVASWRDFFIEVMGHLERNKMQLKTIPYMYNEQNYLIKMKQDCSSFVLNSTLKDYFNFDELNCDPFFKSLAV